MIWYVLVLVGVLDSGQEVVTKVMRFDQPAQCVVERDNFNDLIRKMDFEEVGLPDVPKPLAKCLDRYGNEVSGEV